MSDDNPFSEAQFKTLKYPPASLAASTTSPRRSPSAERSSLGTTPNIAMAGSRCSPRTTCITIEPRACRSSAGGPFKPPGPVSRTLRSRDPTTRSPSPSRLDQPTCDTHNRRNCSVNRNRHCLKVVDRFRRSYRGFNLFLDDDYDPCLTMARGQWRISGFRAVDLRACLAWLTPTRCSSLLKRLRTHGMIKKVGRRYKDYLTKLRRRVVTTALHIREFVVLPSLCVTCV